MWTARYRLGPSIPNYEFYGYELKDVDPSRSGFASLEEAKEWVCKNGLCKDCIECYKKWEDAGRPDISSFEEPWNEEMFGWELCEAEWEYCLTSSLFEDEIYKHWKDKDTKIELFVGNKS